MSSHRMNRRNIILKAKRDGCFDQHQYAYEDAERERMARKIRTRLRQMQPVALVTPRWSCVQSFLDDIAVDLAVGEPKIKCRTLSLAPLEGRTSHQAWAWLVAAVTEFCQLELGGPAWQVVSRLGFRNVMKDLFTRAEGLYDAHCLMVHGLQHIHVEALRDLMAVFQEHCDTFGGPRRFNLLLAGSIDAPHFDFASSTRLTLPDFAGQEACEALVEELSDVEAAHLESIIEIIGGIPAVLKLVGRENPALLTDLLVDPQSLWGALGTVGLEMRAAVDIASGNGLLAKRLKVLAKADGPLPSDARADTELMRAGLVHVSGIGVHEKTTLRSPVFGELVY